MNCFGKFFWSDSITCKFFNNFCKVGNFFFPFYDIFRTFHLRDIHDMHWNIFSKNFVSLFLSITGSFTNIHICNAKEWTSSSKSCSNRSFYKWTGTFWKYFFSIWNPELRPTAKTRYNSVCGDNNFIWYIYTESTENFTSFFLLLNKFSRSDTMYFRDD